MRKTLLFLGASVFLISLVVFSRIFSLDGKIESDILPGKKIEPSFMSGEKAEPDFLSSIATDDYGGWLNLMLPYPKEVNFPVYFLNNPLCAFIIHSVIVDGVEILPHGNHTAHTPPTHAMDVKASVFVYPMYLTKSARRNFEIMGANKIPMSMMIFEIPASAQEIDITYSGLYQIQGGDIYPGQEKYWAKFFFVTPKVTQDEFRSESTGMKILHPDTTSFLRK